MEKISIIVPVYNVEKYLRECIESLLKQTYTEIEIVLVNDGSTDKSKEICEEYLKYGQVKLINQENKGLSGARNTGIEASNGKYIMFIDSDDYLPENAVELLYNNIEDKKADIVTANYINTTDDGTWWEKPIFDLTKFDNIKISIKDYTKSFYVMNSSVCNKIFNAKFINKNNFRFVEGIPAEDAVFSMKCLNSTRKIYYIKDIVYCYRQRAAKGKKQLSISNNCSTKYFAGINKAYRLIYENFKESNTIPFYRYFYAKSATYLLSKFIDSNLLKDDERIEVLKSLKWLYDLSEKLNVPMCNEKLENIVKKIIFEDYIGAIKMCKELCKERKNLSQEELIKQSKPTFEFYSKISKYDKKFESN